MTTKTYMISTEAGWAGAYEGADEAEALDAFARDAGYADYATACREVPSGRAVAYPCEAAVRLARDTVVLLHDRDAFRWYTIHSEDIEVSGGTVADAAGALVAAYPYSDQWTDEGTAVVEAILAREVQR